VSTILNALKRLESNSREPDSQERAIAGTKGGGIRLPKPIRFPLSLRLAGPLFGLSIVVVAVGWYAVGKLLERPGMSSRPPDTSISSGTGTMARERVSARTDDGKQVAEDTILPSDHTPAKDISLSVPAPPLGQGNELASDHRQPKANQSDSGLSLQAIAWSTDPQKRIAVINGAILREGSMVDGMRVSRIMENRVVLRGEEGSLEIGFDEN